MQKFATGRDNLNHFFFKKHSCNVKKPGETMINSLFYQSQIVKWNTCNSLNECSLKSTKY